MDEITTQQKYQDFLASREQMAKPNEKISKLDGSDFIDFCSDDITKQLVESGISTQDIQPALYKYLLGETIRISLESDSENLNPLFLEAVKTEKDLEILLVKMALEAQTNNDFAKKITRATTAAYISKCLELGLEPDLGVIAMLYI
jgi:hypothetical protein